MIFLKTIPKREPEDGQKNLIVPYLFTSAISFYKKQDYRSLAIIIV